MATESDRKQLAARKAQHQLHKALSHELRVDILTFLSERSTGSASEMARKLGESIKQVSHHAQQLVKYGFADVLRSAKSVKGPRPIKG